MTDLARRFRDDPRAPWVLLSVLALSTVLIGWHPLCALAMPVCSYLLGRLCTPGWPVAAVLITGVALSPALLGTSWWDPRLWAAVAAAAVLLGYLPWLVGRHVRDRSELHRAESELAAHLEQRQWELAARTRLRERARIAQEMHDTLGHQLSLIALRAGALELGVGSGSSAESQAAEGLRVATTHAAEQLGEIVGLLAEAAEPTPRQPGPEDLGALVQHAADAGMDVELAGSQADLDGVPVLVARAALRVVQEGLTNAAKHAPDATVWVRVDHAGDEIVVTVRDRGASGERADVAVGGGRGLVGLSDRVEYLGGRLHAEPGEDGFELVVHLPTTGAPSDAAAEDPGWSTRQPGQPTTGRRRDTRSVARVVLAPLALLLVIAVCLTSYFVYVTIASVLTPEEFARIDVGDSREATEAVLPPVQMLEPPTDRLPPPTTPDATCAYYEGEVSFFERREVYRICFADGVVTDTDAVAPEIP